MGRALALRPLEERIVLNGTPISEIITSYALDHAFYDGLVENIEYSPTNDCQLNILVIASDVPQSENLSLATEQATLVVNYDSSQYTLADIELAIAVKLQGRQASHIAFATHGHSEGFFALSQGEEISLKTLLHDPQQELFWRHIGNMLQQDGQIDLLACNLAQTMQGYELMAQLEWIRSND